MIQLKIQTLRKGWHDTDEVILHAMFQLLVDFIEKERPGETVDWSCNVAQRKAWKDMKYLYKWWKEIRPKRRSPLDDKSIKIPPLKFKKVPGTEFVQSILPDRKKYSEYYRMLKKDHRLLKKWEEEDQRNLHKLIDLRKYLWT